MAIQVSCHLLIEFRSLKVVAHIVEVNWECKMMWSGRLDGRVMRCLRIAGGVSMAILLAGCGNIAVVKSFSTKFESPVDGETANLRVISNGMVRGVPNSECVNWYLPGAGVMVAADGFAHRNSESLGMPDSKWTVTSTIKNVHATELRVPAGKPLVLSFLGPGGGDYYSRWQCGSNDVFVPKPGHNYEYIKIEDGRTCWSKLVEFSDAENEEKIEAKAASLCSAWHKFM